MVHEPHKEPSLEEFESELGSVLPAGIAERERVVRLCARHLRMVVETNRVLNLTRITGAREAAVKHVLDSLLPLKLLEGARTIVDVGSGAGFPGIPLAVALPQAHVTLVESLQKKARFLAEAAAALELENVDVEPKRGEDYLRGKKVDVLVARAVAPLEKLVETLGPVLGGVGRLILYKGPDVDEELAEARDAMKRRKLECRLVIRHELPEGSGARSILELGRK